MKRDDVVAAAVAEIGPFSQANVDRYWKEVLPYDQYHPGIRLDWCGAFALFCLHQARLDTDQHWHFGLGFVLVAPHALPVTTEPQPGDILYQAKPFQHHAIVEFVAGNVAHSIDGNQPDVRRKTRTVNSALTFYSIAPLLGDVVAPPPSTHTTLFFGMSGDDVLEWQNVLFKAGYSVDRDGKFGPKTLLYTQVYQRAHGLEGDGIVGRLTWATVEPEEDTEPDIKTKG